MIHEAGNVGLEQRCAGAQAGPRRQRDARCRCDINDLPGAQSTITAKLQSDPSIDGVLTLNPAVAAVAVSAAADAGSKAKLATFDLNADVIKAHPGRQDRSSPSTSSSTCRATCRS